MAELERSPFLGSLFEGFVAAEILKSQADRGCARNSTTSAISTGPRGRPLGATPQVQTVAGRNRVRKDCSAFHGVAVDLSSARAARAGGKIDRGPSKVSPTAADGRDR
jgi:hypothetical protein